MENVKIAMKAIQEEINETTLIITACKRPPQWFIDHLDRLQKAHLSLQDVARQMPEIIDHLDRLQKAHLSLQDVARQMPEITESEVN